MLNCLAIHDATMTTLLRCILGSPRFASAAILATLVFAEVTLAQETHIRMLVPDLKIDGQTNDITAVASLVVAPNGNVIVFGRGEYRGKVFAPNGRPLRNFGRNGRGPGELSSPALQNAGMVGDTLWVFDGPQHIALFTSDGRLIRDVVFRQTPVPWQSARPEWGWMSSILEPVRLLPGGLAISVPGASREAVTSGVYPAGQPLLRLTWEGRFTGAPLTLPIDNIFFRLKEPLKNLRAFQQVFAHTPKYALSADGRRLVIANVRDAARPYVELLHLSTAGDTLATHRVPFTRDAITRRSVDSVIAGWTAPMPAGRRPPGYSPSSPFVGHERELRDALVVPRYFSPFSQVMLANDGTTWLKWHVPRNDRRWLLVSPRGEVLMQVEQPGSGSIRVIDGAIWGAAADSVGFVSVIRFAVREGR
jgi:hypothetical protein